MVGLTGWIADTVLDQLSRAGLLVRQDYYVPSPRELYDLYYKIDSASYRRLPFRWVMCSEILDELKRLHSGTKVAKLREFSWTETSANPVMEMDWYYIFEVKPDSPRLFNIPIRVDPAARTPMIELVEE